MSIAQAFSRSARKFKWEQTPLWPDRAGHCYRCGSRDRHAGGGAGSAGLHYRFDQRYRHKPSVCFSRGC